MSFVRFVGRALFSSYFVADGITSLTQPDRYVDEVERTVSTVLPKVQRFLPDQVADKIPEDMTTWTRIFGGLQVAAGAGFALGILRRPSAALLAITAVPGVVSTIPSKKYPKADQARTKGQFFKNLALFGAALVATQDLQGRPSIGWRLSNDLPRRVDHSVSMISKDAQLAKASLAAGVADAKAAATSTFHKAKDAL